MTRLQLNFGLALALIFCASAPALADTAPLFVITPLFSAPSTTTQGQTITAIYQVLNNSARSFTSLSVVNLQTPVSLSSAIDSSYCNSTALNLSPGASCLLKVQIDTSQLNGNFQWNPKVCADPQKQFYCSQAFNNDQVAMTVSAAIPLSCSSGMYDLTYELSQAWGNNTVASNWGNDILAIAANPSYASCYSGSSPASISWQQTRVLAVADFLVSQKLNYCHHYLPDFLTPTSQQCNSASSDSDTTDIAGCCSLRTDLASGPLYGQVVRWNYTGTGSETATYWQTYNRAWYGMDCTNFTRFIYDFAFGTLFTGDTPGQAGQNSSDPTTFIGPNQQTTDGQLTNSCSPGVLVCGDGTADTGNLCVGHGGDFAEMGLGNYFSIIDSTGTDQYANPEVISMIKENLSLLQPGDIVYIAGSLDTGNPPSAGNPINVTHGVLWLNKTVGYGSDQINPHLIAPDDLCLLPKCNSSGAGNIGNYVIADSHYQGPDYRVFTDFFYLYDLWGVRRIINSGTWAPGTNCNPPD